MAPIAWTSFVVTRNAYGSNGVDYLAGWDAQYGTVSCTHASRALRFNCWEDAFDAKQRAERLVPAWITGGLITYGVINVIG